MAAHGNSSRIAPAMTALAVIAGVAASLWWSTWVASPPTSAVTGVSQAVSTAQPAARAAPLKATLAFVRFTELEPPQELPLGHDYTAEGLRRLAATIAEQGGNGLWRDRARRLEEAATAIERDAHSLDHADIAQATFLDISAWIANLRGDAAGAVADAARRIDRDQALRLQRPEVIRFFRAAADALRADPGAQGKKRA